METATQGAVAKLSHTHLAILDYMLVHPKASMGEVALAFGYTAPWLSTLINSDLFQEELRVRRAGLARVVEEQIRGSLEEVAKKGIHKLGEIMDDKDVDARVAVDITKTALQGLGFGKQSAGTPATPQVNIQNNFIADSNTLAQAKAMLMGKNNRELPSPG